MSFAAGWLISLLVEWGLPVDAGFSTALEGFLTALFGAVYYVIARVLEVYVSPRFGWLLGFAQAPVAYGKHAA